MIININENFEVLRKFLRIDKKTFYLNTPERIILFPFKTREPDRAKFEKGFSNVTGEVLRTILGVKNNSFDDFESYLKNKMNDKNLPVEFIDNFKYLVSRNSKELISPEALLFNQLSTNDSKIGEKSISEFLVNTLFSNSNTLKSFYSDISKNRNYIMSNIISGYIQENSCQIEPQYINSYSSEDIIQQFQKDLKLLLRSKVLFVDYFEILLNYYYFRIVYRNALDISNYKKINSNRPLYFLLDWESASKNREACKEINTSFASFYKETKDIYIHMNILEHLNILFGVERKNFKELSNLFEDALNKKEIKEKIIELMNIYSSQKNLVLKGATLDKNLEELYQVYFDLINQGLSLSPGASNRYHLSLLESCKYYFLKKRGSLGYVLNINHDFLILLVYLSVNENNKINLIEMFESFELRGVYLDKYSKESVVDYLVKLNLIDKKSDSGVAQYVRSIL